jgi:hypothetical protein
LLPPYGGSGRALRALTEGPFVFVTSESILYEVATILSEPRVQRYGAPFHLTKSGSALICFAVSAFAFPADSLSVRYWLDEDGFGPPPVGPAHAARLGRLFWL